MKLEQGNHRINYTSPKPFLLVIDGKPIKICEAGSGTVRVRNVSGKLSADPQSVKPDFEVLTRPAGVEAVDDAPTPPPAPPPNFLAAMRQQVRQSMGVTREAFAEHRTIYEDVFEETGGNPDGLMRQPDAVIDDGDTGNNDQEDDASGHTSAPLPGGDGEASD